MTTEEAVAKVRNNAGWIKLDRLGLIRVAGPNRVKFLHNMLSNDISGLTAGQSRLAALMNVKGQQVAWMSVLAESEALICELPLSVRDIVVDTFIHYKVGAPVRFEKLDAAIFGLFGSQSAGTLRSLGVPAVPEGVGTFSTAEGLGSTLRVSRGRDIPATGFTLHTAAAGAPALEAKLRELLGDPITEATLETLRVEEGIPWHGVDVKEENLLHETGQLSLYHSSTKGCYLGQEVVARLEGRGGNVNKHLRGLKLAGPVAVGAQVSADDKIVGHVTSVGQSPEFGPIAMGFVHRSHADSGSRVQAGGTPASVVTLPFAS